jgi:hypothetical protein
LLTALNNNRKKEDIMKKRLLLLLFLFTSVTLYAGPIEKLKKLADKIEKNYKTFTDEDWDNAAEKYAKLEMEFREKERTNEELKEFGRQKGRIKGYMTKKRLDNWSKKVEKYTSELGGGIEGFLESIEKIIEE